MSAITVLDLLCPNKATANKYNVLFLGLDSFGEYFTVSRLFMLIILKIQCSEQWKCIFYALPLKQFLCIITLHAKILEEQLHKNLMV